MQNVAQRILEVPEEQGVRCSCSAHSQDFSESPQALSCSQDSSVGDRTPCATVPL